MALFMASNDLTKEDVLERGQSLSFPESVVSLFRGELGQPHGGFPKTISDIVLKGEKPFTERPNAHLEPIDFEAEFKAFQEQFDAYCDELDFLSFKLYPKVFMDFYEHWQRFGPVTHLPTPTFFYGLKDNEEVYVEIGEGKAIIIKKLYATGADENGVCKVYFELNGQARVVEVLDRSFTSDKKANRKAVEELKIGSPLQGRIAEIKVEKGQKVAQNDTLFVIEAMKMETTISAPVDGVVKQVHLLAGDMVEQDDLVVEME